MQIAIVTDGSGNAEAHAVGCADAARKSVGQRANISVAEYDSKRAVIENVYGGFESLEEGGWRQCAAEEGFRFLPCCKLPDSRPPTYG